MEKLNICGKRYSSETLMLTLNWDMQTLVGDYSSGRSGFRRATFHWTISGTRLAPQMVGEPSRVPDLLKVNVHLRNQTWRVHGRGPPRIAMEKHNCK